jgi:hypothetical protein
MNFPTRTLAALAALSALVVAAPAASANDFSDDLDGVSSLVDGCGYTGTDVFAPWGDRHDYTLVPDGGFENGADGWTLDDGAAVVEGNETFQVGGAADHQSLNLPAGSSATSPSFCVSKKEDITRFFVRSEGGRKAKLKVEVVYTDVVHGKDTQRLDKLRADDNWDATDKLEIELPRAKGKVLTANVALRFTPLDDDGFQVDDVYIDPRLRH